MSSSSLRLSEVLYHGEKNTCILDCLSEEYFIILCYLKPEKSKYIFLTIGFRVEPIEYNVFITSLRDFIRTYCLQQGPSGLNKTSHKTITL